MSTPSRTTENGVLFNLSDGTAVEVSLVGACCEGVVDDGCIGFTDQHGNHQTLTITDADLGGVSDDE